MIELATLLVVAMIGWTILMFLCVTFSVWFSEWPKR